jgi:hypothetical protein
MSREVVDSSDLRFFGRVGAICTVYNGTLVRTFLEFVRYLDKPKVIRCTKNCK